VPVNFSTRLECRMMRERLGSARTTCACISSQTSLQDCGEEKGYCLPKVISIFMFIASLTEHV
jgi:hypothetical protein